MIIYHPPCTQQIQARCASLCVLHCSRGPLSVGGVGVHPGGGRLWPRCCLLPGRVSRSAHPQPDAVRPVPSWQIVSNVSCVTCDDQYSLVTAMSPGAVSLLWTGHVAPLVARGWCSVARGVSCQGSVQTSPGPWILSRRSG